MTTNLEVNSIDAFRYIWLLWQILGMKDLRNYRIAYYLFTFSIHTIFGLLCPITIIAYLILKEPTSHLAITNFAYFLSLISASAKNIIVWILYKRLCDGNMLLHKLDIAASCQTDEQNYLRQKIQLLRYIFIGQALLFLMAGSVFVSVAVASHELLFEAWTPFDLNDYYIETVSYQTLTSAYSAIQSLSCDLYGPFYMLIVTAHKRILRMRLTKISGDDHNQAYENLVNCIKDHQTITEYNILSFRFH